MKQALHIFRKDVRRLWPALVIMFLSQTGFVYSQMGSQTTGGFLIFRGLSLEPFAAFAMLLSWWYVVVSLIHQEPIPGDRQFWTTRPYSWKSLLAAKALFIILFINFAIFIADCVILISHNFSPLASWQGLVWRQIPFTALVLLPFLALAGVTRHLGQIILTVGALLLLLILNSIRSDTLPVGFSPLSWIASTIAELFILTAMLSVLVLQYRSRASWWMRGFLAASIFVAIPLSFSLPASWQLRLQNHFKPPRVDTSAVNITLDSGRSHRTDRAPQDKFAIVALPLKVTGLPAGVELISGFADFTVDGESFSEGATLERKTDGYWATISLPKDFFQSVAGKPVDTTLQPIITAFQFREYPLPQQNIAMQVPSVGRCQWAEITDQFASVSCESPFVSPKETYAFADPPGLANVTGPGNPTPHSIFGDSTDSPLPAGLCLSPVSSSGQSVTVRSDKARVLVRVQQPLAHFQGKIRISGAKLSDYALPR